MDRLLKKKISTPSELLILKNNGTCKYNGG